MSNENIVSYYGCKRDKYTLRIYLEYIDMGSISSMLQTYGAFNEQIASIYT